MDRHEANKLKWTAWKIIHILNEEQAAKGNENVPIATCYKATLQIEIAAIDNLYKRRSKTTTLIYTGSLLLAALKLFGCVILQLPLIFD